MRTMTIIYNYGNRENIQLHSKGLLPTFCLQPNVGFAKDLGWATKQRGDCVR